MYDILYIANLIPPGLSRPATGLQTTWEKYERGRSLKVGHWDFEWILEHDIDRPVCINYDYEWLLFTIWIMFFDRIWSRVMKTVFHLSNHFQSVPNLEDVDQSCRFGLSD